MSEKYYVVSEEELKELYRAWIGEPGPQKMVAVMKAEAAARARPVRFLGAHAEGSSLMLWGEE